MTREGAVVKACLTVLEASGIPAFRNNTGAAMLPGKGGKLRPVFFGSRGWPDIVGVLPSGKFLGVECKAPKEGKKAAGKITPEQRAVGEAIEKQGGVYLIVRDAGDLAEWIKGEITKGA